MNKMQNARKILRTPVIFIIFIVVLFTATSITLSLLVNSVSVPKAVKTALAETLQDCGKITNDCRSEAEAAHSGKGGRLEKCGETFWACRKAESDALMACIGDDESRRSYCVETHPRVGCEERSRKCQLDSEAMYYQQINECDTHVKEQCERANETLQTRQPQEPTQSQDDKSSGIFNVEREIGGPKESIDMQKLKECCFETGGEWLAEPTGAMCSFVGISQQAQQIQKMQECYSREMVEKGQKSKGAQEEALVDCGENEEAKNGACVCKEGFRKSEDDICTKEKAWAVDGKEPICRVNQIKQNPSAGKPCIRKQGGDTNCYMLNAGDPVYQTNVIETDLTSLISILCEGDEQISIGTDTSFEVIRYVYIDETEIKVPNWQRKFRLIWGRIRTFLGRSVDPGAILDVETRAAIAGVRGTDFIVEADKETQDTVITVIEGKVETINPNKKSQSFLLLAGERIVEKVDEFSTTPQKISVQEIKTLTKQFEIRSSLFKLNFAKIVFVIAVVIIFTLLIIFKIRNSRKKGRGYA